MAERLATPEGKAQYRRRKVIPEPVFGWIKHVMGFRQFSLRGLTKVTGEWSLVCLALNVRRNVGTANIDNDLLRRSTEAARADLCLFSLLLRNAGNKQL
jgi:hypothetical protein